MAEIEKKEDEESQTSTQIAHTWNSSHEILLSAIAERSNCNRWLHNKCQRNYDVYNFYLTIPSILISALSGSATIGLTSLFPEETIKPVSIFIGLLTLGCGALTSINQYMKTSQFSEAHRAAAVAYGKLHRLISSELILRKDQRVSASSFIHSVRAEQDRLEEISPIIMGSVIREFKHEFRDNKELEKPEIVGDLDKVVVNMSNEHQDNEHVNSKNLSTFKSTYYTKPDIVTPFLPSIQNSESITRDKIPDSFNKVVIF
jgi:hypothetical protein